MKKIEAFIKPFRLEEVKVALLDAGVSDFRVTQVQECGGQVLQENYRGTGYEVDFDARILLMMVVEDGEVPRITELIRGIASTENESDGKILILPLESIIEI